VSVEKLQRIVVVGQDDFAREVADAVDHEAELELVGAIGTGDAIPDSAEFVICMADLDERTDVIRKATSAGLPVATLPLSDTGDEARAALTSGKVVQVSPLRGYVALETLRAEVRRGVLGQAYGLFAAHRFGQVPGQVFGERGGALLHYVYEVIGEPLEMVQTTRATLFGSQPDACFIVARASSGLLLTLEFAASLVEKAVVREQVLVEATGSGAVLRAEPTRQSILISGRSGTSEQPWWISQAPGFVAAALSAAQTPDSKREVGFLDFLAAVRQSADAGEPVMIG
jgi:hypothetical protein